MKIAYAVAVLIGLTATRVSAQESTTGSAASLVRAGQLAAAEAIYDSLLAADADDIPARLSRGHLRSWQHNYDGAHEDFRAVFAQDPTNLSAHLGTGYAYAWEGRYDRARDSFERAQRLSPGARESLEGLAFVALWSGQASAAVDRFDSLVAAEPNDLDLTIALGQAYVAAGRAHRGRATFERALALDPSRTELHDAIDGTRFAAAPVELAVWGGYTSFAGAPTGRMGLRLAQLSAAWQPGLRVWLRYDNGLSLDNPALATAGENVPSYTGGAFVTWAGRLTTKVEAGWRTLPSGTQRIYAGEQTIALGSRVAVSGGVWLGDNSRRPTEWLASGGFTLRASRIITLQPRLFVSSDGVSDTRAVRGLLLATLRPGGGTEWSFGAAFGRNAIAPDATGSVGEAFLGWSLPVTAAMRAHFSLRHQRIEGGTDLTIVSLGATLGVLAR